MDPAEAVGELRTLEPGLQWAGRGAFFAALCATGVLERVQFRLKFLESRTWWASNGRDVLNLAALAALVGSAWLVGFSLPVSVVIGATVLVLLNALQAALGRRRFATRLSMGVAVLMGLPALVSPGLLDRFVRGALRALF